MGYSTRCDTFLITSVPSLATLYFGTIFPQPRLPYQLPSNHPSQEAQSLVQRPFPFVSALGCVGLLRLWRERQVVIPYPPRPIEAADTMQRKVHDALKEHTKRIPLRGLLEAYLRAAQEWEEARDRARSELAGEEAKMVSSLPPEADLYPWTLGLVGILERGQPIKGPSGRSYAENKGNDGTYKPSWGEFSLTRSPIRQAILTDIVEAHEKLVSTAEPYLLKLQNQHQRLKELTDQIADELDGFLLKRLVPGRCRFCPF